jgi:hypothetical protein
MILTKENIKVGMVVSVKHKCYGLRPNYPFRIISKQDDLIQLENFLPVFRLDDFLNFFKGMS